MSIIIHQGVSFQRGVIKLKDLYYEVSKGKDTTGAKFSTISGVLQRLSQVEAWKKNDYQRAKEYLYSVLTGASILDQFILVPSSLVLESLKRKAEFDAGDTPEEVWKETINQIKKDIDNGTMFYIIDGQNRCMNAIVPFFESDIALGSAPITGTASDGSEIFFQGKKYEEFTDEMKEYVDNIEMSLIVANKGQIDDFTSALIAKNEGLPWEEWMKKMTVKWWTPYRRQIHSVSNHPQVRETLNKISGQAYMYEKNGHDLIVSELLIWMNSKFQPNKVDEHLSYFDGRQKISDSKIKKLINYITEFGKGYKKFKSVTNVEFRNYIMTRYALDHPSEFSNILIPNWTIKMNVDFTNEFRITNGALKDDVNNWDYVKVGGRKEKRSRVGQYVWACGKSENNRIEARLRLIFDYMQNVRGDHLFKKNIVVSKGSSSLPSLEAVYANNPDTYGDFLSDIRATEVTPEKYDRGHIVSKHNGGSNDIDNLVVQEKGHNRSTQEENLTV